MEIYFVVKEPSERTFNHFVDSLGKALEAQGCEVVYGLERLWTDDVLTCDIVHFQWPEYIFGAQKKVFSDNDVKRVRQRLSTLKEKGIKIFLQIHNLKPHTNTDKGVLQVYDVFYQYADVMVHMGRYSLELLEPKYPNVHHVVVPHHIYDNILTFTESQQNARRKLKLPEDKKIVLSFGKFRDDKEREFVLALRKRFDHSVLFLMPGFYRETLHTWNPKKLVGRLYHTLRYKLKGIRFSNDVIPDELMQCYFCAADVVLIQRLDILNSGNLPMAFAAGKVVVGPRVGNVGGILEETKNFAFTPVDIDDAAQTLQRALAATEASRGEENKMYAEKYWSCHVVAKQLIEIYQSK